MYMESVYGNIKYIYDTHDGEYIYVYGIGDISIKTSFQDEIPRVNLLKADKYGKVYFRKGDYKVYLDDLEEINL